MSAFASAAFSTSAFSTSAFSFDAIPAKTVIDVGPASKRRDERHEEQRQARERLREQIRQAIDGPQAPIVIQALEAIAEPGPGALELRVEFDALMSQVEVWKLVREAAEAYAANERAIDEDDEEVLTLL